MLASGLKHHVPAVSVLQSVHRGPGGHAVSFRHEGPASRLPAPHAGPPGDGELPGRGKQHRGQREVPFLLLLPVLPRRHSGLPQRLLPGQLADGPAPAPQTARLSGVRGVSVKPGLAPTEPLVSLRPVWFPRGESQLTAPTCWPFYSSSCSERLKPSK